MPCTCTSIRRRRCELGRMMPQHGRRSRRASVRRSRLSVRDVKATALKTRLYGSVISVLNFRSWPFCDCRNPTQKQKYLTDRYQRGGLTPIRRRTRDTSLRKWESENYFVAGGSWRESWPAMNRGHSGATKTSYVTQRNRTLTLILRRAEDRFMAVRFRRRTSARGRLRPSVSDPKPKHTASFALI